MLYVRKFSKLTSLEKIKTLSNAFEIDSDFLHQELRTSSNTLSFWECENMDCLEDTIKTILLSMTSIETSQFIIIDESILKDHKIEIDRTSLGKTGYKDHAHLHVDLCNLTYSKIGDIIKILKSVATHKDNTPKYEKNKVKDIIRQLYNDNLIDLEATNDHLRKDITKYYSKST